MKFAVTYDNGNVFQHFGQTRQFMIYDDDGSSRILDSGDYSHGTLATLLKDSGVKALLCGGIGDGARNMLNQAGIHVYPGMKGSVEDVAEQFKKGNVTQVKESTCHHDHECHCHK